MKLSRQKKKTPSEHKPGSTFFGKSSQGGLWSGSDQPFFGRQVVQPKLSIGQPNDKYEQEADAMADNVVQRLAVPETDQTSSQTSSITSLIQPKCAECEKEEELQTKPTSTASHASPGIESNLAAAKGSGSTLPAATKAQMESSFGVDFSGVKIHNDSTSVQMNKDLNSQAFTHGSDIYFNSGKFDTQSNSGKKLLAHELTHVVQQGGRDIRTKSIGNDSGNEFLSTSEPVVQGFDIPFTDYETDFSWSGVKTAGGLVGSGVKKAGKWVYNRGKYIVGNAWGCAKAAGTSVTKLVTGDFDSFADLVGMQKPTGEGPAMVDWISFVLTHPCLKMIPGYEAAEYLVDKFSGAGRFLKGAWHMVTNPDKFIEEIHTSPVLTGMMDGISSTAMERAIKSVTFSTPSAEIMDGIWRHLKPKLDYFLANWWEIVKSTAWDLLWPWPGVGNDLSAIWGLLGDCVNNFWDLNISDAIDNILEIWRTVNTMLGRLYLWFVIASVIIGAVIGAFFGGAGAVPGALLGLKVAMAAGQYLLVSTVLAEVASIGKAGFDLVFTEQSQAKKEEDFEQISTSAITLAITGIMAALSAMAVRFAKGVISKVAGMFQQASKGTGGAGGSLGTGGGSGYKPWTPRVLPGGKGTGGNVTTPKGTVAQGGGGQPTVIGNTALKPQPVLDPVPVIEPAPGPRLVPDPVPIPEPVPIPDPAIGQAPITAKGPSGVAVKAPVIGGLTGVQIAENAKKKKEKEDKKKIYQWQTPFNYQGRDGQVNYAGPTIPGVIYIPNGHHVWPEVLGGDPSQTLMTVITTIHNEEIHYGRSPIGSPVIALYGSIYNFVTNYLNNSQTFGPNGSNVLQGRRLTHTGGPGSANQLLITAMSAGTTQAARLTGAVRYAMTLYYGFFRALSSPRIPYSAYRQGLDDSYDYIV